MPSRRSRSLTFALYLNAALLGGVMLALLSRGVDWPQFIVPAMAQTQLPIAGGAGIFVMPAQFSTNTWGCYLMDVDAQTLVAYQYLPGEREGKNLRLVAARSFRHDRQLASLNTFPDPSEIKKLVEMEKDNERVRHQESMGNQPPPTPPKQD